MKIEEFKKCKGDIDSLINKSSDEMEPLPLFPSGEGIALDKGDILLT